MKAHTFFREGNGDWAKESFPKYTNAKLFLHFLSFKYTRKIPMLCKRKNKTNYNYLFGLLIFWVLSRGFCKPDIRNGYKLTLATPVGQYRVGRAFLMETEQITPNFRVALSIETVNGKFSCSVEVFLGDVKVWNSGHYSRFYVSEKCVLELTEDGDLQLKGSKNRVGWRTGTPQQGVERLLLLKTGNLVLVDVENRIKWQSFNFPTDVMLWGQRLNVATRLTSFPVYSSAFYSFEIQRERIALYLHSGKLNYSYWEFKPSKHRNITFVAMASKGLELFNDRGKKIAQIYSQRPQPLRFLALGNKTGNLGLYYYSANEENFQASFQALNTTCDLPLACKPCGICTFSNSCSSILQLTKTDNDHTDCSDQIPEEFCSKKRVEMCELQGVSNVLRDGPKMVNITKEKCSSLCINDCKCVAALYSSAEQECFIYGMIVGVKQVDRGNGLNYMIKVPEGTQRSHGKSNVKKWVMILVGAVDGFIILLGFGWIAYYLIQKRRKNSSDHDNNS